MAVSDKAHIGFFEWRTGRIAPVPSEYKSLTPLVDTLPGRKDAAIGAMKAGLRDTRDRMQDERGHVHTGVTTVDRAVSWGRNQSDSEPAYVLGVCNVYAMSGDRAWLEGFRASCRAALEFTRENHCDPETGL